MRETKQRNLILEIINNSTVHLIAEDIYKLAREKIPNISLGTVYRNLNFLLDQGSIRKIKINSIDHFDNVKKFHNHFICTKCNTIYDVFEKESRTWNSKILKSDEYLSPTGRVMDSYLSEHVC